MPPSSMTSTSNNPRKISATPPRLPRPSQMPARPPPPHPPATAAHKSSPAVNPRPPPRRPQPDPSYNRLNAETDFGLRVLHYKYERSDVLNFASIGGADILVCLCLSVFSTLPPPPRLQLSHHAHRSNRPPRFR